MEIRIDFQICKFQARVIASISSPSILNLMYNSLRFLGVLMCDLGMSDMRSTFSSGINVTELVVFFIFLNNVTGQVNQNGKRLIFTD